ncbi:MAG: putative nicotinate-nucleotide pyrophosphorylase [carboxylating] [Gemmatimonadaceae bacterium]|nr:putative nicotinate-nucleotide pyrophosphorylase [carboxylating] [Gemmatimonadaceae bacterium]
MTRTPGYSSPTPPSRRVAPLEIPAVQSGDSLRFPLSREQLQERVREALIEDGAFNDITTIATVRSDRRAHARLVSRETGVVAGIPLALEAFRQLDPKGAVRVDAEDGTHVKKGDVILAINGHARGMLSAERVALNFLQRLSGIATLASRFVEAVHGTSAAILDTRKTTPGWRSLEKYAVRAGGGRNHRLDLAASVLIKDNHLAAVDGSVAIAVQRAREIAPANAAIEVECESIAQVTDAIAAGAHIILLDNMPVELMARCVALVGGRAKTEASGGIALQNVRSIALTGVDFISVGALTHSAPAMNMALDFE